jgi:hypothetical protein
VSDEKREFIEVWYSTGKVQQVRIGNWIHTRDLRTGESWWDWDGPEGRHGLEILEKVEREKRGCG